MKPFPFYLATFILFMIIGLTSCDPQTCRICEGHSEDLSYYRDFSENSDIQFRNSLGDNIKFVFIDDVNNFSSQQCNDYIEGVEIPCNYEEDFNFECEELDILFIERANTYINPHQDRIVKNAYIEYSSGPDSSSFVIENYFPIDSTHIAQLIEAGLSFPVVDTLTNNLITYYDVFKREIAEVRDLESRNYVPTNVFESIYIKPRIGIVGFRLLDGDLFLREE